MYQALFSLEYDTILEEALVNYIFSFQEKYQDELPLLQLMKNLDIAQ